MNFQQLEYIVALNTFRNFVQAADHCHVTQPTLTMMVKKLEEELGMKLFDRSKSPLQPTEMGELILAKARRILSEAGEMRSFAKAGKEELIGPLRIGIIPTLAPYLLPLFLPDFLKEHTQIELTVIEQTTAELVAQLKRGEIDVAILVGPLEEKEVRELPLFHEPLLVYASAGHPLLKGKQVEPRQLNADGLWLLEEGHCFRSQVLQICSKGRQQGIRGLHYQSGSLETLKAMVDRGLGYTLVPELSLGAERKQVRRFQDPQPTREVCLAVYHSFYKEGVLLALQNSILASVPKEFKKSGKVMKVKWR
jgi:LysR family hydrogen peroxide-inducible transcriptional activator